MNEHDDKLYRLFLISVEEELKKQLGEGFTVQRSTTLKNNSVELDNVVIRKDSSPVAPCIFLNAFFPRYSNGVSIEDIAKEIIALYNDNKDNVDVDEIGDCTFENLKDHIFFKLVSREKNMQMLDSMPYVEVNDLALVFACSVRLAAEGVASIRIDNAVMERWGIDKETLLKTAYKNTPRLFPPKIFSLAEDNLRLLLNHRIAEAAIEDLFEEIGSFDRTASENGIPRLYVLTNTDGINGASCIMYEGLLDKIYRRLGSAYYIIPSSVHEVLIFPDDKRLSQECLANMVDDVNSSAVPEQDILSYRVYRYPGDDFLPKTAEDEKNCTDDGEE